MKTICSLLLTSLLPLFSLLTQSPSTGKIPQQVDQYLTAAYREDRFNGVALVLHRGTVLFHKAYGIRHVATKAPNDTTTRFPLLSITKSFTAALILKLQEQGKLSIDDKLSQYLPGFAKGDSITLHQLLTHTSGLFNYTELIDEADSALVCHPVPKERIVDIIRDKPMSFSPGKQFSYCNSGYFLLGLVIEKVTGKSYEQSMRELILQPLGMSQSGFDFINLPAQSRAFGYDTLTARYSSPYPHPDSTVLYAAGGLYSTTGDMLRWAKAVTNRQLLSAHSWQLAFTPRLNGYGYGWQNDQFGGKPYLRHSGGYPGFMSEFVHYPKEELTIILFNNFGNYGDSLFPIVQSLSVIVFGMPDELWLPKQEVVLEQKQLEQYVGRYVADQPSGYGANVVLRDGRLYSLGHHPNQLPELALYASKVDHFFPQMYNSRMTFQRDSSGKVISCVIQENGQRFEWKRVD
ncbi:serine hydrolase [Spirosoma sp. KUDC1026]|uniref:serine hydrolase n=1 Tax=Spirosoma sp. KUDC1026 TaxID=2745947 RepID=UPI00159BA389|nr:serine hydrolase [Spirosoma sp. KUDC1026]QKZ15570.1 serine hydrolase [Spirosoma sp. KUDC1026]